MSFRASLFWIYHKDSRHLWRRPWHLLSAILFAFILAVLYGYAIQRDVFLKQFNFDGIMLCSLFIANTLLSGQSFAAESETQALRIMHMSALEPSAIYLGKLIVHWQSQLLFISVSLPLYFLLLQGQLPTSTALWLPLFICLTLCALSLAALGTLIAAAAQGVGAQVLLLPVLLLPQTIPILLFASQFMAQARQLTSWSELSWAYYLTLLAPAMLYTALGSWLYFHLADDIGTA